MRESWIVIAALMCAVAAIVIIVPILRWVRRTRRRGALHRAFVHAVRDGQARAKFRREKETFGDGFIDTFVGTAGTLRFRLTRRFRPFETLDAYGLELDRDAGAESFHYDLRTPDEDPHPVARCYRILRDRYPMGARASEAS